MTRQNDHADPAAAPPPATSKPRDAQPSVATSPAAPGSVAAQDGERLAQPHERDESNGDAGDAPREIMKQAKRDLDAGQVDTDLRGAAAGEASRKLKSTPG